MAEVEAHGAHGEIKEILPRAVAPFWLWPAIGIATIVGFGWAVWPILYPA